MLKSMVKFLQKVFRGRLYKLFAVNLNWLVRGLWSVAKTLIDEFTITKIGLYGADFEKDILQVVSSDCLEQKYGGKLDNKEKDFFPP